MLISSELQRGSGADVEPELAELMNEVASHIPTRWRDVGIQLNLSLSDLNAIGISTPADSLQRFSSVFHLWRSKLSAPYNWSTVIHALEAPAVNETRLARRLRTSKLLQIAVHNS